ncbi:MAG: hypothetical protein K2M36_01265 [Clostridia bacterium]|nr:hypothetical protein [Clostridia bacterium]
MFCFVACNPTQTQEGEKNITVYIGDKTFEVTTEQLYLHGVLLEMLEDEKISAYVYTDGAYGVSFSQVDEISQDPTWTTPPFLSLWHNVDEFTLKSVYNEQWASSNPSRSEATVEDGTKFVTTTYKGVLLYYSGTGIGSVPVIDGGVYAILVD